jgi:UDP-N-acetyl-D-mannosaminuronate dehydrogenase
MQKPVIVIGLGEIGKPLLKILKRTYSCVGIDMELVEPLEPSEVLHICYPFQIRDFVGATVEYIGKFKPELTIINSTVVPGTTLAVAGRSGGAVAYSPVRGKHAKMKHDMLSYKKFVGADEPETTARAIEHFAAAGFQTAEFAGSEIAELSKLLETTWLGVLVGWAQEVERLAASKGASYAEVNRFIEEIAFLPSFIFPGEIGGHCVMQNIALLRKQFQSEFLDAVLKSNEKKAWQERAGTTGVSA